MILAPRRHTGLKPHALWGTFMSCWTRRRAFGSCFWPRQRVGDAAFMVNSHRLFVWKWFAPRHSVSSESSEWLYPCVYNLTGAFFPAAANLYRSSYLIGLFLASPDWRFEAENDELAVLLWSTAASQKETDESCTLYHFSCPHREDVLFCVYATEERKSDVSCPVRGDGLWACWSWVGGAPRVAGWQC